MVAIFSSRLTVEKNNQLAALVKAARNALAAMKSEDANWKGEGYQGDYSEDEIKALEASLQPFEGMYE